MGFQRSISPTVKGAENRTFYFRKVSLSLSRANLFRKGTAVRYRQNVPILEKKILYRAEKRSHRCCANPTASTVGHGAGHWGQRRLGVQSRFNRQNGKMRTKQKMGTDGFF